MTITDRYQRLLARRMPADLYSDIAKSASGRVAGENTKYLVEAMRPLDDRATRRLIEQGDRVQAQLEARLTDTYPEIAFRRQGSVSNGTHIKHYSDVDVLVLIDKYVALQPPQQPSNPYRGDPIDDLTRLRARCRTHLSDAFPAVRIDDTGPTAITLEKSGSLLSKVDVVPSNWFDTLAFAASRKEHDRGVQVLNREKRQRITNFPFLFNRRIDEKDEETNGLARMLIRLLKSIRAEVEEGGASMSISSFDVASIVYRTNGLRADLLTPLSVLIHAYENLAETIRIESAGAALCVIDDSRRIFDVEAKLQEFVTIMKIFNETLEGAKQENRINFRSDALLSAY